MNVFSPEPLRTEAQIEPKLSCSPRFMRMPSGKSRMLWMPKLVWEAEDFVVGEGVDPEKLIEWGQRHSQDTGYPFEITYPCIVYEMARCLTG